MYKKRKLKNKIKKFSRGGNFDYESAAHFGNEMGMTSTPSTGGGGENSQTAQAKKTLINKDTSTSAVISGFGKTVFDVTGAGLAFSGLKKAGTKLRQVLTPKIEKQTAQARLSGSPIYDYRMKGPKNPTIDTGNGDDQQPLTKILKKPLKIDTPKQTFSAQKFFPFRAFKSGGVPSGPPPLKGPNSQVPPVKMRKGKMTKAYKFSCPSRPDGIRGMGAAIKGHKFTGVK
tara:strand:- start:501 stop:1187 length:687 start_codon:yes stop_codon:yes gene_type:complete